MENKVFPLVMDLPDWQKDLANLSEDIQKEKDTFGERLRNLKNQQGLRYLQKMADVSGLNRDVVSRIRGDRTGHHIEKRMAISIALATRSQLWEINRVLEKAGFVLSDTILFDRIIIYFIKKGYYDFLDINECLIHFGFSKDDLLGSQKMQAECWEKFGEGKKDE